VRLIRELGENAPTKVKLVENGCMLNQRSRVESMKVEVQLTKPTDIPD